MPRRFATQELSGSSISGKGHAALPVLGETEVCRRGRGCGEGVWRGSKDKTVAKGVPTVVTGLVAILVVAATVLMVVMVVLMVIVVSARGGDGAAGAAGVGHGEESWW